VKLFRFDAFVEPLQHQASWVVMVVLRAFAGQRREAHHQKGLRQVLPAVDAPVHGYKLLRAHLRRTKHSVGGSVAAAGC
jgi:hypothetical protein